MMIFFRRGLFLFIFINCSIICSFGQRSQDAAEQFKRNLLALKFSPLPLLDFTPAIQFGAEIRILNQQTLQVEYGYVTSRIHPSRFNDFTGFKLKGEYRFYNARPEKITRNLFWGIQYMYKEVKVNGNAFFWRANRSYQELLPINLTNYTNSAFATAGQLVPLFGTVQLELAAGLGIRKLDVKYKDIPEDAEIVSGIEDERTFVLSPRRNGEGTYYYPGFFCSVKFVVPILR